MRKALWALILCALVMASPAWSQDIAGAELYSGGAWSPAPSAGTVGPLSTVTPVHLYCYNSSLRAWVAGDSSCFAGSGTVNTGTTGQLAYYPSNGAAVSGTPGLTYGSSILSFLGSGQPSDPFTFQRFDGSFLGVTDPILEYGFNHLGGAVRSVGVPAVWQAVEANYANNTTEPGGLTHFFSEWYVSATDAAGKVIRPFYAQADNQNIDNYLTLYMNISPTGEMRVNRTSDGALLMHLAGSSGRLETFAPIWSSGFSGGAGTLNLINGAGGGEILKSDGVTPLETWDDTTTNAHVFSRPVTVNGTHTVNGNAIFNGTGGFASKNFSISEVGGQYQLTANESLKIGATAGNVIVQGGTNVYIDAAVGSGINIGVQTAGQPISLGTSTSAITIPGQIIETLTTPASSSAACTAGLFTDDANFHYVCTATNTWKRAALSAF